MFAQSNLTNMNKLAPKIWHAIFSWNTYTVVAQEMVSPNPGFRRWAALHMVDNYEESLVNFWFIKESRGYRFCLIVFDLNSTTTDFEDGANSDEISNALLFKFNTEEELYTICTENNIDPEKFVPYWRADYPFH